MKNKSVNVPLLKRSLYKRTYKGISKILGVGKEQTALETLQEINKKDPLFINYFYVNSQEEDNRSKIYELGKKIITMPEFVFTNACVDMLEYYTSINYIEARLKTLPKEKIAQLIKLIYSVYEFRIDKTYEMHTDTESSYVTEIVERYNYEPGIRRSYSATCEDFKTWFGDKYTYLFDEICNDIKNYEERLKQKEQEQSKKEEALNKKITEDIKNNIISHF